MLNKNKNCRREMKKEIRLLGVDDCAFDKFKDRKTLLVGVMFRGSHFIDGVMSETVSIDGTDSTAAIARMVNRSKFHPQIRAIMLKGIAVAGFNIVDIRRLNKLTKIPVIVVMRRQPDRERMLRIMRKLKLEKQAKTLETAGEIHSISGLKVQLAGITPELAKEVLQISCAHSNIPEPIRVAHLIAGGVKLGESRGKV